jgi:TonB-dependent receptor
VTCIRNYILRTYHGTRGVTRATDANGNFINDANGNATGVIVGQPTDPVADFRITIAANQRSDKLNGLELNFQHTFDNGLGFSANYTKVKSGLKYDDSRLGEQFAIPGVSDSANLVLFYEDETWGARLAYNWRDKFLTSLYDGSGPNPIYVEAYGQVDLSLSYNWDKNLSVQFEAINVTDATSRSHQRRQEILHFATQTGPRYVLGARYKF